MVGTGSLNTARFMHESQLLPDGRVLAFGGDNGFYVGEDIYNSAEIFNPSTNVWTIASNMLNKRSEFASVVLSNGNIMAIGGGKEDVITLATCEIYNASTGTWSYAAPMQQARRFHEAIMLRNGKVLVVGGTENDNRSELYDPSSNTWTYTSDLSIARGGGVSLVMLNDGRILATGGGNSSAFKTAEIYDPVLQTWTKVSSSMNRTRIYHTSILLNDGRVLIVGGNGNYTDQITSEIFNPVSNSFTTISTMQSNVGHCEMALMDDGRVLIYGMGNFLNPTDTKCLQVYDPNLNQWSTDIYPMIGANAYSIHRLNNGKILIVGGNSTTGNGASSQCLLIDQPGYGTCSQANLNLVVSGETICKGKDVKVTVVNSESDANYQAYYGNILLGAEVTGGGTINLNFTSNNLSIGPNSIKVQVRKNGCLYKTLMDTAIISIYQSNSIPPDITSEGNLEFCAGSNVSLSASSGSSFLWSNGAIGEKIIINHTGRFSVKSIDASGCLSLPSLEVKTTMYDNLISAGNNENICQNTPASSLVGHYPPGGTWTGSGVTSNGIFDATLLTPGTYTLSYNQCSKIANKIITVLPSPHINPFTIKSQLDSMCSGNSTFIELHNPTNNCVYQLKSETKNIGDEIINYGSGIKYFNTGSVYSTTIFSIRGTHTTSCGTQEIIMFDTIKVPLNPTPHIVITQDTVCLSVLPVLKIPNSDPKLKYNINYGTYFQGNGDTLSFTGHTPFKYGNGEWANQVIVATNSMKCKETIVFSKSIVGYGHKAEFNIQQGHFLNETIQVVNKSTGDSYKWTFDNSASQSTSTAKDPLPYNYATYGVKSVKLISKSRFGCSDTIIRHTNIYDVATSSVGKACLLDTIPSTPDVTYLNRFGILDFHVDVNNNNYISGYAHNDFGGNYSGSYSMYLKKLDPAGNLLWETKQNAFDYPAPTRYYSTFISGISTDAQENVYITGSFSNINLKLSGLATSPMENPYVETFIAKLNSTGEAQWIIYGINTSYKETGGTDILYVDNNHVYVSLYRPDILKFPDGSTKNFEREIVLLQIDRDGTYKNSFTNDAQTFNSFDNGIYKLTNNSSKRVSASPKIKLSSNGRIFMAGSFNTNVGFGSHKLTVDQGYPTFYIAILDTVNGWQNAFPIYSNTKHNYTVLSDVIPHFTLDQNDNIYVTDSYVNSYPGSKNGFIKLPDNTKLGDSTGSVLAKYDQFGNLIWFNHNSISYPKGIEYLSSTNEIITYGTYDNMYMGQTSQNLPPKAIKTKGKIDSYLASTSPNGDVNWIEPLGSIGNEYGYAMKKNTCNDVVLLGMLDKRGGIKSDSLIYSDGKLYLARFSPTSNCQTTCNNTLTALKVSLYSSKEYRTNLSPFPLYIKFNRSVTGFDVNDLVITNATITSFTGTGSEYKALLTPLFNGVTVNVQLPAGVATDGISTNLTSNKLKIIYDTTIPNVTISSSSGSYFKTSSISISITASEGLIDLIESDIQLTNCVVTNFSGNGKNYSATITPIREGALVVKVPAGAAVDSAGNANNASNVFASTFDKTPPAVVISSPTIFPTAISPIPIEIIFSEPMLDFNKGDIHFRDAGPVVNNLLNPSGDLKTYTADIVLSNSISTKIIINSWAVTDLAGNENTQAELYFSYDNTKPSVTIFSNTSATTSANPIPISVVFSENISGLTANDFIVSNGTISNLTGSGSSYTISLHPIDNGEVTLQLPAGSAKDTVGNLSVASTIFVRNYDKKRPEVEISSTEASRTKNKFIYINFTWSENVNGFSSSDLIVTNGTVTSVNGSGKNYTTLITATNQGIVSLIVKAGAVQDLVLNSNLESSPFIIEYDNIGPSISITSSASIPTLNQVIPLTITFSEDVTGFTQSDIIGNNISLSNFTGTGSVYTVDVSAAASGSFIVQIPNNVVTDILGNGNLSSIYSNSYQGTDNVGPVLVFSTSVGSPTSVSPIFVSLTFSEAIVGFSQEDVLVSNGILSNFQGSGIYYSMNLHPSSEGNVSISLITSGVVDLSGNVSQPSSFQIIYSNPINPISPSFLEDKMDLYPNPSNGLIKLSKSKPWVGAEISISNIAGLLVYKESISEVVKDYLINISSLVDGVYHMHIKQDNESIHRLIIIQH
jgi:hypothetical protein